MSDSPRDLTALFETVIQIEEVDARDEFIEESCGTDSALREQLKELVKAHERAGNFLLPPHLRETCVSSLSPGNDGDIRHSLHMSVVNLIGRALDGQLPRVVLDSSPGEGPTPIVRPGSAEMPTTKPESRYRLDGEIARGGMGAILKGRDTDLGRDLAVKVLLDQHRDKPSVIQRFVEEAQIGGQLQHPGIVPVYELGQFDDQRPFFTMKLVKGKTLLALLDERRSPEEDRGRFLGIFEQVCQTMAYAHSRGVIHRDLKPSNIMVGAFGEVQVMDWGLAKVLSEGGVADEKKAFDNQTRISIIQTIRSLGSDALTAGSADSAGSQTQMGSVMGTPAYMPPEQALGEIDRLNPRSDVFGLGSILCEILTGSPPYTGESQTEIYRKASRAKLEECFERLSQQNIDEELTQVVRDSLQPEPEDRNRDASVLARRIGSYQASVETRMREAELAKAEANARAVEERKRRRVVMALAATILATVGLAGGGWAWLKQKDAELARVESERRVEELAEQQKLTQRINTELSTARALANLDEEALPDADSIERALAAVKRARHLADSEPVGNEISASIATVGEQVEAIGRDFALVAALDKARE
ncbi:MAG: serine/threonine-protein kinase, partial [Planctomycetaceae bacterium]